MTAVPDTLKQLIHSVLAETLGDTPIDADLSLGSVGLDSMATVELLIRVEKTFGVTIPDELLTVQTFATPAALWAVIAGQQPRV
ncbi:phosphopantetheine-binding protein [Micromonospora sp. NPDC048843]|uniref:phosphopantetheine-binding protein n=1 Tax=Micromonospora sp. NPDC048843 TaxID=3155389 RepID=UPI0033C4F756